MSKVNEAKNYIFSNVIDPALNSKSVKKELKPKVKKTKLWIEHCRNIGNIYDYIKRYSGEEDPRYREVYEDLKKNGLTPIEDIIEPFSIEFKDFLDSKFTWKNLIIGESYSSWDLAILSNSYNVQRGIHLVESKNKIDAILTKVTMDKGKYPNKWINKGKELKHLMYAHSGKYDPEYKTNKAIINSRESNTPILVFEKIGKDCRYVGNFKIINHEGDADSKWFNLVVNEVESISLGEYYEDLEQEVRKSKLIPKTERLSLLRPTNEPPTKRVAMTEVYNRNPHVVAETLNRANGNCELCKSPAPFLRASDNSPYLEVHHVIPLAAGGVDIVENTLALCPNCHRREHFG